MLKQSQFGQVARVSCKIQDALDGAIALRDADKMDATVARLAAELTDYLQEAKISAKEILGAAVNS